LRSVFMPTRSRKPPSLPPMAAATATDDPRPDAAKRSVNGRVLGRLRAKRAGKPKTEELTRTQRSEIARQAAAVRRAAATREDLRL
ncbi:MAG: hypothetical protein M3256_24365, partial [Actinomycetota bacterium]|nr:hypothetical protein [Actinomycetota bacterium]